MNKILTVQIVLLVGLSGGIVGILSGTEIYNNIRESIVITTCLSCIKMDPISIPEFTFLNSRWNTTSGFYISKSY